jgi:hypothetical protein
MNRISYTPLMVIDYMELERWLMCDLDLFISEIEKERLILKQASNFRWDNPIFYFTNIYGTKFAFQLYKMVRRTLPTYYTLAVWGEHDVSICDYELSTSPIDRKKQIKELYEICDKWTHGEVKCSKCGEFIKYQDNRSHRYFAGIYCLHCWEGGMKQKEANESYN